MIYAVICFAFLSLVCSSSESTEESKIKHFIVMMLENRSFDHMLGFLKSLNSDVDGCLPDAEGCSNPIEPSDPESETVTVDDSAVYVQVSPDHSVHGTTFQVFGSDDSSGEADMSGFIKGYAHNFEDTSHGVDIMKCFSPEHVPVITQLATEFGFFDGWFASVPGPTEVNRAYVASATSHGSATNDEEVLIKGFPQKSMFRQLSEMGLDFRVYFEEVPTALFFKDMRHKDARTKMHRMDKFYEDAANGDLPEYTFLEPAYFDTPLKAATDQHPDHDVSAGEELIKSVYDAVRNSPAWNNTALLITYDEHGGFFDHVIPPHKNVPNPDGMDATDDPFDFQRLGVRVPAVIVSPWVKKGTVIHASPDGDSQYEHSSVAATVVHKLFKAKHDKQSPLYLTKRDAWAKTFEWVFDTEETVRTDCPMNATSPVSHREAYPDTLPKLDGLSPLSHMQAGLVLNVAKVVQDTEVTAEEVDKWTEAQASAYITNQVSSFLAKE